MKRFLKSGLSFIIAITIILSSAYVGFGKVDFSGLFSVKAKASNAEGLVFTLCKDGYSVAADRKYFMDGTLNIPAMYNGLPVVAITFLYWDSDNITSVFIPDTITDISCDTFNSLDYLTSINVAENNSNYCSINGVLYNKAKTTLIRYPKAKWSNYEIPKTIKTIGEYAFYGCSGLTKIDIHNSIINIGNEAFSYCNNLTVISIPNSVTSIGESAFRYSEYLYNIQLGDGIEYIGSNAFHGTGFFGTSNNWKNGVLYIDKYLVATDNNLLEDCIVDDGTKLIAEDAFLNCNYLQNIDLPGSLLYINQNAFFLCNALSFILVPDSVRNIGERAFGYVDAFNVNDNFIVYGAKNTVAETYALSNRLSFVEVDSHKHTYSGWLVDSEATCTTPGLQYKECTICGDILETNLIPTINHTSSNWIIDANPTCSELGSKHKECTVCGIIIETAVISTIAHTIVKDNAMEATCTIPGKTAGCHCAVCGEVIKPQETIPATGHVRIVYGVAIAPTCTTPGESSATFCFDCGEELKPAETIPATGHTYSGWVVDSKPTASNVGWKHNSCTKCGHALYSDIPRLKPATPKLTKVQNTASGAKVTWGAVEGADSYIVYRRTYNAKTKAWGGWARLASGVTSASYADKNVKSGTYYRYTVKAVNVSGNSGYNTSGIKTYFLAMPKSVTTSNTTNTITVKWGKVTGATGYIVYRKTGDGKWTNLGKTTGTSFTDKKATAGVTYKYTVKAYFSSYVSSYNTNGYAVRRLTTPKLSSATSKNEGILLAWNKVTGATGYIVYRKAASGEWKAIATIKGTSKVKYLDETPRKGATYQYCIKAYYGTSRSANSNIIKLKCKY